jgi:hypothetical protein
VGLAVGLAHVEDVAHAEAHEAAVLLVGVLVAVLDEHGHEDLDAALAFPHVPVEVTLPTPEAGHVGGRGHLHRYQDGVAEAVVVELGEAPQPRLPALGLVDLADALAEAVERRLRALLRPLARLLALCLAHVTLGALGGCHVLVSSRVAVPHGPSVRACHPWRPRVSAPW